MTRILLLGRLHAIVDELTQELEAPGVGFVGATKAEEARAQLGDSIDLVVMGGGLDDGQRTELCKLIWSLSDNLTIHIKDKASGPQGMAPFVGNVIKGFV